MSEYAVGDDVRYRQIDGFGVLLDLATERYSVMDEAATSAWAVLTGEAEADLLIRRWTHEYEISADEVRAAIDEFGADCLRMGWLRAGRFPSAPRDNPRFYGFAGWRRRLPGGLVAFWALILTAVSLKFRGFRKTYRRQEDIACVPAAGESATVENATRAFLFAENFVFFRRGANDCLVRSLALFRYLRWVGIPATHVIGIRRTPFAAHAWVEIDGKGVLSPAVRGYSKLAVLMPTRR